KEKLWLLCNLQWALMRRMLIFIQRIIQTVKLEDRSSPKVVLLAQLQHRRNCESYHEIKWKNVGCRSQLTEGLTFNHLVNSDYLDSRAIQKITNFIYFVSFLVLFVTKEYSSLCALIAIVLIFSALFV